MRDTWDLEAQAQFNLDVFNFIPPLLSPTSWRGTVERIECPILLLTGGPQRGAAVTEPEGQASHFLHHEMQGEQFDHFIAVVGALLKDSPCRGEPTR